MWLTVRFLPIIDNIHPLPATVGGRYESPGRPLVQSTAADAGATSRRRARGRRLWGFPSGRRRRWLSTGSRLFAITLATVVAAAVATTSTTVGTIPRTEAGHVCQDCPYAATVGGNIQYGWYFHPQARMSLQTE